MKVVCDHAGEKCPNIGWCRHAEPHPEEELDVGPCTRPAKCIGVKVRCVPAPEEEHTP